MKIRDFRGSEYDFTETEQNTVLSTQARDAAVPALGPSVPQRDPQVSLLRRSRRVQEVDGFSGEEGNDDTFSQINPSRHLDHLTHKHRSVSATRAPSTRTRHQNTYQPERIEQEVNEIHGAGVLNVVLQLPLQRHHHITENKLRFSC